MSGKSSLAFRARRPERTPSACSHEAATWAKREVSSDTRSRKGGLQRAPRALTGPSWRLNRIRPTRDYLLFVFIFASSSILSILRVSTVTYLRFGVDVIEKAREACRTDAVNFRMRGVPV